MALPFLLIFHSSANNFSSIDKLTDVNDIYQDDKGYVWIAGQHGLTRYDGEDQINFSTSNEHWPQPFTWVHQVTPFNNKLLISTQIHGLYLFNPADGTSEPINAPNNVKTVYFATHFNNKVYFESEGELYVYDTTNKVVKFIAKDLFLKGIVKTKDRIYFIRKNEVLSYTDNKLSVIFSGDINTFAATADSLVITTNQHIYLLDNNSASKQKALDYSVLGMAASSADQSVYLLASTGKVYQYDTQNLHPIANHYPSFRVSRIKKAFHDSSGVLWVASNNGITRLTESSVKNHPKVFNVKHNANEILFIEDELIIATYGDGLHTMNGNSKFIHPKVNESFTENGKKAMSVIAVGDDILLGTFDGVWAYQANAPYAEKLSFEGNDNIVLKLVTDRGKLYIGTNRAGLKIYDLDSKRVIRHIDSNNGLKNTEIIDVLPLPNGEIWLAASNNVEIYNPATNRVRQTNIAIPNKVISLNFANNKIYAFTKGSGILVFDLHGELLSRFAESIDFNYGSVIEDEIWVSAKPGVYRLSPDTHLLSLVPGSESYSFSGLPIRFGDQIYAWHSSGLLQIKHEKNNVFDANIDISMSSISGYPALNLTNIALDSPNDVVTMTLASLDHRKSNKKRFQYRINNSIWTNTSGNQITLTGLTSGTYDIEVKGSNSLGQWSANHAFATITVAYPWYWTPQIRIIYAVTSVCLLLLGMWLIFLRANSLTKVHQLLESELKSKGKKALSISRNLNLAIDLIDKNNIDHAKQLISQCVETLETVNSQKEPDSLYGNSLSVALPYLGEYLHQKYHIKLTEKIEVSESTLDYELEANIYKIIYESITSALLNSDSRQFSVHIQEFKSKLWLTISDNENSFAHFNNSISFNMAMYYVRQIAEKYNASVNTFEAQDDKGSQLVISFPLMSLT